jgi:uncharacterized protein (DUF1015 family)
MLPFRGLRYTPAAGALSDVVAPPYDVISPAQQQALEGRSPYNAVRLELAEGGDERYAAVAALLGDWQTQGVVARDEAPMIYVYEQRFMEAGREYTRRAVLMAVEAQPWAEGAVKPHEFTMSGPKEDRLKLLEATRTQFSPVFMIARDRAGQLAQFLEQQIASRPPDAEGASIDGDYHRLWAIEAGRYEMRQLAPLLSESFYIADGHHRYETAVNYRDQRATEGKLERDHPARFAMTAVVAASDPGLVIRPIHRIVPKAAPADWETRLSPVFDIEHLKLVGEDGAHLAEMHMELSAAPGNIIALGLDGTSVHLLKLKDTALLAERVPKDRSERWAAIPPNVLRYGVLEPLWNITDDDLRLGVVEYDHDAATVAGHAQAHPGTVAFLLNPVDIDAVMALADQGERMPQKSTFFHPKLGTGLVFNPLEP